MEEKNPQLNLVENNNDLSSVKVTPEIRLISLGKTQILNYIAPIFYTESIYITNIIEILQNITNDWKVDLFKDNHVLNGCEYLGLTKKLTENRENFILTQLGSDFRVVLEQIGYGNQKLIELKKFTKRSRKKLHEVEPKLSFLIRMLYERKEEYRNFLKILYSFNIEEVSFREIIDEVIEKYTTMFIKVFCKQSADIDKLKQLYLQDKIEQIKSKKFLEDYLSLNVYFAFKIQLLHLGVLQNRKFQDDRKSGGLWKIQ